MLDRVYSVRTNYHYRSDIQKESLQIFKFNTGLKTNQMLWLEIYSFVKEIYCVFLYF